MRFWLINGCIRFEGYLLFFDAQVSRQKSIFFRHQQLRIQLKSWKNSSGKTWVFSRSFLETLTQNCDSWACLSKNGPFGIWNAGISGIPLWTLGKKKKNIAGSQNQVPLVPSWYPPFKFWSILFGDLGRGSFAWTRPICTVPAWKGWLGWYGLEGEHRYHEPQWKFSSKVI